MDISDSSLATVVVSLRSEAEAAGPGGKLPSSRLLVQRWGISPVTLSRAVGLLIAEGVVVSRPGSGVFATERAKPAPSTRVDFSWQELALGGPTEDAWSAPRPDPAAMLRMLRTPSTDTIDLAGGYLHESLQPSKALAGAMGRAGRRPGTWAQAPAEGIPELRSWFALDIGGRHGPLSANEVLICSGGQAALVTALRALTDPGQSVLVESPTYPGTLAAAWAAGLRCVPIPVDDDGLRVDLVQEAFDRSGARVIVCQPQFQNPTGAVLSTDRRSQLMEVVKAAKAFVIEDDFARDLVHDDAPALAPPLAVDDPDGHVVHIRSLTKAASPSLRIAALTARGAAYERLRSTHVITSFAVSRPLQETALELVASPAYATHLRRLATALRERRDTTTRLLAAQCPYLSVGLPRSGGYLVWVGLPAGLSDDQVSEEALRQGVAVSPGTAYYAPGGPTSHVRLSYMAPASLDEIEQGIERLDVAVSRCR